jgi:hypothetical protein
MQIREFWLSSSKFEGYVRYQFDKDSGLLYGVDTTTASLSFEQLSHIFKVLPKSVDVVNVVVHGSTTSVLTEIHTQITFEMFWEKYDDKLNSSKKRTLSKWNKMGKNEHILAYNFIDTYFRSLPSGTRKKYAETYLNAELWNN